MQSKIFIAAMLQAIIFFNAGAMDLAAQLKNWSAAIIDSPDRATSSVIADLNLDKIIVLSQKTKSSNKITILHEDLNCLKQLPEELQDSSIERIQIPGSRHSHGIEELKCIIRTICEIYDKKPLMQITREDKLDCKVFNIVEMVADKGENKDKNPNLKKDNKSESNKEKISGVSNNKKPIWLGVGVAILGLIAFLQYKGYIKIPYISCLIQY